MNLTATLFGQMITFAILIWFVNRVLWRPLTAAMADRTRRIDDGLTAAEHGRQRLLLAEDQAQALVSAARDRAGEIIAQAQERRGEIAETAKREAQDEKARILVAAEAETRRMVETAREQLRKELAGLVVEATGRIVGADMDASRHGALLDHLAAQL